MNYLNDNEVFSKCMEKVESYIKVNNDEISYDKAFEIFTEPYKIKIEELRQELEILKNANKKVKSKKVRQGVKLTDKQIEYIKELSCEYRQTREQVVKFFNKRYPTRKKPLTISQLRKIMEDNNIVKPKRIN